VGVAEECPEESTETVDVEVVAPDGAAAGAKRPMGNGLPLYRQKELGLPVANRLGALLGRGFVAVLVRYIVRNADDRVDRGERATRSPWKQ